MISDRGILLCGNSMDDIIDGEMRDLKVWTVKVPRGSAKDLLAKVSAEASRHGQQVLVVKGELVFGADHFRTALYHAKKAMDEARNVSDSLAMETLLYLSGERQLSGAIKKMSVDDETEEVAVACLSGHGFASGRDWNEMARLPEAVDAVRLKGFGISDLESETLSADRAVELVLERVAAVDILKK